MNKEKKYPVAALLRSRALEGYQKDFAKALLPGEAYTLSEAKAILDRYFKRKDVK